MTTAITTTEAPSQSLALIRHALETGADPASLRELLAVKRDWEADEAKKAYFAAISEFQREAPIIEKGDDNNGKKYARMDRIWRAVRPLFTKLGLSCTWQGCEIGDGGKICHVTGQLGHILGHSVPLIMDVAIPELIRGQNAAQQIGSARTYAQRYAFCAALGLQTGEDDDAHGVTPRITTAMADELVKLLEKFGSNWEAERDALLAWRDVESMSLLDLPITDFELVRNAIKSKQEKLAKKAEQ